MLIANKIFYVTVLFHLFTFAISLWQGNSSQQTSLQCLTTSNVAFNDEDKILTKTHKYAQHTQLHA